MSTIPPAIVYTGYWVDHSHPSSVLGATLTVTASTANLLIAFLTSLISLAGLQIWELIAFFCFFYRVRKGPSDGVFHQQQILLRNVTSPNSFALYFIRLAWSWSNVNKKTWMKCLLPALLTFLISAGFIAAGLFSSRVVVSSNFDVLVDSPACGFITPAVVSGAAFETAFNKYMTESVLASVQYSKKCYNTTAVSDPTCSVFVQSQLPQHITHSGCPFSQKMCTFGSALTLDTGLLDTQENWGINAKPADRVQVRRTTTCVPIKTEGYLKVIDAATEISQVQLLYGRDPYPAEKLFRWHYGDFVSGGKSVVNTTTSTTSYEILSNFRYSVKSHSYFGNLHLVGSSFIPIPELMRNDAEVHLIFIASNQVLYVEESNDPIFSAHQPTQIRDGRGETPLYRADQPAGNVIGCVEQLRYCNPTNGKCTSLSDQYNVAIEASAELELNKIQNATIALFNLMMPDIGLIPQMTYAPIVASETLQEQRQYPIPANQWEYEVQARKQAELATMQKFMSDYAIGGPITSPESQLLEGNIIYPTSSAEHQLCRSQKMRAPSGFSNVSVFGLSFISSICAFIILLKQAVPRFILYISRRRDPNDFRVTNWIQDGVLQVQRKAFQGVGIDNWQGFQGEIPITLKKEEFASLAMCEGIGGKRESTVGDGQASASTDSK